MQFARRLLLLLLVIFLSGCSTPAPTIQPTQTVWSVQITPALGWMKPIIHKCTLQDSATGVFLQEIATADIDFQKSDVTFTWGKTPDETLAVYELGIDSLSIIVNSENEQSSLTLEQLTSIIDGEITQWQQIGSSIVGDIAWWMVPSGDEGLDILVKATGAQPSHNPFAWIAPDAEALLQAVAKDPSAMGFIPSRWLNESVKSISLDGIEETILTRPVLAITRQQPEPQLTNFLQCIQSEIEK